MIKNPQTQNDILEEYLLQHEKYAGQEITDKIYSITDRFPKSELYGLAAQMRRASVSIPSNIAEGSVRRHSGEYRQFLYIS